MSDRYLTTTAAEEDRILTVCSKVVQVILGILVADDLAAAGLGVSGNCRDAGGIGFLGIVSEGPSITVAHSRMLKIFYVIFGFSILFILLNSPNASSSQDRHLDIANEPRLAVHYAGEFHTRAVFAATNDLLH